MTLPREFFAGTAAEVAPALLGQLLRHDSPEGPVAVVIVEAEAYAGQGDPASHAFRGRTARTAVMFGPPGHAYVYFTYGMHFCVNLVCRPEGEAAAVLLRAGRVVEGTELAAARRARPPGRELARGPARLCQALGITRSLDGADVCDPASPLQVLAGPGPAPAAAGISAGPRIGISRAAEVEWRFWIAGEPCVSAYRPYPARRARPESVSGPGAGGGSMHR